MNTESSMPSDESKVICLQGATGSVEFQGRLLERVTTESDDDPRWLELEVYQVTDGTGRYVLYSVGKSVIYHQANSICNRGALRKTSDADWPEDAESCWRCHPADWKQVPSGTVFRLEIDRPTTFVCNTPAEVIENLKVGPHTKGKLPPGTLSGPARGLLDAIARVDEGFAAVMNHVERL